MKTFTTRTQRRGPVVSFSSPNTVYASANYNSIKASSFVWWRNQMTESEPRKRIPQLNGSTCVHERSSWANRVLVWLWSELAGDSRQIWGEPEGHGCAWKHQKPAGTQQQRGSMFYSEPGSVFQLWKHTCQTHFRRAWKLSFDAALKVFAGHKLHIYMSTFLSRKLTAMRLWRVHGYKYRFFFF